VVLQKQLLFILPILLFLYGCDSFLGSERKIKPYDPQKAGATIVESFNITGQVRYFGGDVAEYNNSLYISRAGFIYIFEKNTFEKNTFEKIKEIQINLRPGLSRENSNGLVITSVDHAFLFYNIGIESYLYSLDLATGDAVLIDEFSDGVFSDVYHVTEMGYNIADDSIWFRVWQNSTAYYLFFRNDADEMALIFIEQKEGFHPIMTGYNNSNIYGNVCWLSGAEMDSHINNRVNVGIYKYSFENPAEELHFIDVEYLNTLSIPQSAHYDGEHIWLMVERNDQIQMLKLLPHG
jgi:hypothetical protein